MKTSRYQPLAPTFWQTLTAPVRQALGMKKAQTRYYDSQLGVVWNYKPKEAGPIKPIHKHWVPRYASNGDLCVNLVYERKPQAPGAYEQLVKALTPPRPRTAFRRE